MIIYDLSCSNDHRFEGWFRCAGDFDSQMARQLVRCPQCDSASVRRIPSAVAIGSGVADTRTPASANSPSSAAMMPASAEIATAYRALVQAIVAGSEDVGASFAEEARRIHYNEAPERAIRGQASQEDCEALRDEGIEILHLPLPKDDALN